MADPYVAERCCQRQVMGSALCRSIAWANAIVAERRAREIRASDMSLISSSPLMGRGSVIDAPMGRADIALAGDERPASARRGGVAKRDALKLGVP